MLAWRGRLNSSSTHLHPTGQGVKPVAVLRNNAALAYAWAFAVHGVGARFADGLWVARVHRPALRCAAAGAVLARRAVGV